MKILRIFIVFLSAVLIQNSLGQEAKGSVSGYGLEQSTSKKLGVSSVRLSDEETKIGLREDRIQTKVELKLRSLGIEPVTKYEKGDGFLVIDISTLKSTFYVKLTYLRWVEYQVNGQKYEKILGSWDEMTYGLHGGSPEYIISSMDGLLEEFLNDFLISNPRK